MKHPGTPFRSVLALVLLGAVAAGCFSLGMWQLDRAAQRDALHDTIERGRLQAPVALTASSRPVDFLPWRAATAQGRWLTDHTVLLENRNLHGRPGYWVATPLALEPAPIPSNRHNAVSAGSAEIDAVADHTDASEFLGRGPATGEPAAPAVLVLRGWLPRDMQSGASVPPTPAEPGVVEIHGELHAHVPRIFELWEWAGGNSAQLPATLPPLDGQPPVLQNVELGDYARSSGLRLLPTVLAQTQETIIAKAVTDGEPVSGTRSAPVPHALQREWPGPSLDSDQNRGYALQWFSFCAIAAIAGLFVTRGLFRNRASRSKQ